MNYELNEHNKEEFPPAHTAEHLLNQTMIRLFGCGRSYNAHVERKKSKMSFHLDHKPSRQEEKEIERRMNELITDDLPVTFEFVTRDNLPDGVMLDIKAFFPKDHRNVTGADNNKILENATFLGENKKLYEVRAVIVPDLYDVEKNVSWGPTSDNLT